MQPSDFNDLYPGANAAHVGLRLYCLRVIAHRIRKFGFEEGLNHLKPADLKVLASYMPPAQGRVITEEVNERLAKIA